MDITWAITALHEYGLMGIFLVIMLEYACLPMPSEVLLPFAGMAAAAARIPFPLVVGVSVLAGLMGSAICYALGAYGGRPLLERMLGRFPGAIKTLNRTSAWQEKMGGLSVMTARVIPLFRTWVSFASGLSRQPFLHFMLYSAMGILLWNTLLLLSGQYMFAAGLMAVAAGKIWLLPLIVISITLAVFGIRRWVRFRRKEA